MRDLTGLGVIPALLTAAGFAAADKYIMATFCAGVCVYFVCMTYQRHKELRQQMGRCA